METFIINGIKCIFGGVRDGDKHRPLNEEEKERIAKAVAKAVMGKAADT